MAVVQKEMLKLNLYFNGRERSSLTLLPEKLGGLWLQLTETGKFQKEDFVFFLLCERNQ